MSSKGERDFVTGVYQCKDPIKNFKIKVKFQQDRTTLIPLPDFEARQSENNDDGGARRIDHEERIISWQEKIYSPFEISYYSQEDNCRSPLEEKYHNEVTALCKHSTPKTRIFTYTDADNFNENEHTTNILSDTRATETTLAKGMAVMQQRCRLGKSKMHKNEINVVNHCVVDYLPSEETKKRNHFLQSSLQSHYILVDLSTNENFQKEEDLIGRSEYMLCSLKYNVDSDTLFVTPDFSTVSLDGQSIPYCIEVDGDSRNVYQYCLEHYSESPVEEDKNKEETILTKLLGHQLDIRQMKVGTEFELPQSNVIMMYIMGEVVCAEDFEYDDLFVHFLYELPKGWSCASNQHLSGVTQKCRTNGTGMAYFGHLFETHLMLKVESVPAEGESVRCWPQLFAEVLSYDSWGCFRVEGYCCMKLPHSPGQHSLKLPTWRPVTRGPVGELRRFFVGGSPGLEDLSSVGIPATFEGDRLSKLGFQTTSSGTLHLRFNIIHQLSTFNADSSATDNISNSYHRSFLLERLSATSLVNSVSSVMAAFKKARERMLQAREGLDIQSYSNEGK